MSSQFEEYKIQNNIDTYFSQVISKDSGGKVLKDIADFIKR
jgi:hypothetical protein